MAEQPVQDPERLLDLVRYKKPFGRFEGRLIIDLPQGYLVWFERRGFPPGKLGELMQRALEVDHNGLKPHLEPHRERER